jgi:hypothetical protein
MVKQFLNILGRRYRVVGIRDGKYVIESCYNPKSWSFGPAKLIDCGLWFEQHSV